MFSVVLNLFSIHNFQSNSFQSNTSIIKASHYPTHLTPKLPCLQHFPSSKLLPQKKNSSQTWISKLIPHHLAIPKKHPPNQTSSNFVPSHAPLPTLCKEELIEKGRRGDEKRDSKGFISSYHRETRASVYPSAS